MARFEAQREHGNDWKVVDNQQHQRPIATGLDQEEAEILADKRNTEYKNNLQNA